MGLGNTLRAILHLDTRQWKRKSKEAKRDIRGVGAEAKKTSAVGDISFRHMATGVGTVATAAVLAIGKIKDMSVAIAKAADDAAKIQARDSSGLAGTLGDPLWGQISDVTGWSEAESYQRTMQAAGRYDIAPGQIGEATKRIYSRAIGDKAEALDVTMQFARARGATAQAGQLGGITPLLQKLYGMDEPDELKAGYAQLGAAAEPSAYTSGIFGSILGRVGPSMKQAGMGYQQTLAYISGMSEFMAEDPMLAAGSLDILTRLKLKMPPGAKAVLAEDGVDLATASLDEIRLGMVRGMKRLGVSQFAEATNLDVRVLRGLIKTGTPMFQAKYDESMAGMQGASWDTIDKTFRQKTGTRAARMRRAELASQMPQTRFGEPGSKLEAVEMLKVLKDLSLGGISRNEQYTFLEATNEAQTNVFGTDTEFTEEQAQELQALNALYPRVVADLRRIASHARHRYSNEWTDEFYSQVQPVLKRLIDAHKEANSLQKWGSQVDYLSAYADAMRDALHFIRRVAQGDTFKTRSQLRGSPATITPSQQNITGAQRSDVVESLGLTSGNIQMQINNFEGPFSRKMGAPPKADK